MSQFNAFVMYFNSHTVIIAGVFIFSFLLAFVLGLSTAFTDREKKKKGFRMEGFQTSYEKKLDRQLLKESKDNKEVSSYLQDDQEYFANKKFK